MKAWRVRRHWLDCSSSVPRKFSKGGPEKIWRWHTKLGYNTVVPPNWSSLDNVTAERGGGGGVQTPLMID